MTGGEDRRTTSVKLLWDLVFVFAVTQVSTLLARDLSWTRLTRERLRGSRRWRWRISPSATACS